MEEQYTRGVVIERAWEGERDARVLVYTEVFGKVQAKVQGMQRFTSKLSGHLVPGTYADLRIVERKNGGLQIVESFSTRKKIDPEMFSFLHMLDSVVPLEEPDKKVWEFVEFVMNGDIPPRHAYRLLLEILGFGPDHAPCAWCGKKQCEHFIPRDVVFLCRSCFNRGINTYDETITFSF
jgi:recombinational DNA repair protein (RecF pathway)